MYDSIELLQCLWLCSIVSRQRQVRSDRRWGGQGPWTRRSHLGRQCRSKAHGQRSRKIVLIASKKPRRAARKRDERRERKASERLRRRTLAAKSRALLFTLSLSPRSLQLWWERHHLFTSIDRKSARKGTQIEKPHAQAKKPRTVTALESESTGCSRRAERYEYAVFR